MRTSPAPDSAYSRRAKLAVLQTAEEIDAAAKEAHETLEGAFESNSRALQHFLAPMSL